MGLRGSARGRPGAGAATDCCQYRGNGQAALRTSPYGPNPTQSTENSKGTRMPLADADQRAHKPPQVVCCGQHCVTFPARHQAAEPCPAPAARLAATCETALHPFVALPLHGTATCTARAAPVAVVGRLLFGRLPLVVMLHLEHARASWLRRRSGRRPVLWPSSVLLTQDVSVAAARVFCYNPRWIICPGNGERNGS